MAKNFTVQWKVTVAFWSSLNETVGLAGIICHGATFINLTSKDYRRLFLWDGKEKAYIYVGKGKFHPRTGRNGSEGEQKYNSTLSLTSGLDVSGWLTPRLGRFTPGKECRCPLHSRLGEPQSLSGRVREISPTRFRPPDRQACSESLYRLSYPGPLIFMFSQGK
jgi:hypothetical protein